MFFEKQNSPFSLQRPTTNYIAVLYNYFVYWLSSVLDYVSKKIQHNCPYFSMCHCKGIIEIVVVLVQPQMGLHKCETLGTENITGGNEGI